MADYYRKQGGRADVRPSLPRSVPSMVFIGLIYVFFATAPILLFDYLSSRSAGGLPRKALPLAGVVLGVSFQTFLVYSLLFLRTGARNVVEAVKKSIAFARSRFLLTFLLVLTVYLVHRPIDYILSRPDKVVLRFDPEMVFFFLLGGILLELVTSYLLFSSTASIVLAKKKAGIG